MIKTTTVDIIKWPDDELEFLGRCPVCGSKRRHMLYEDLHDRLFGAPGCWTLYRCASCASGYLDPRPTQDSIGKAYACYATHDEPDPIQDHAHAPSMKRLRAVIRNSYLNRRYGYRMQPTVPWGFIVMYLLPPPLRMEWDHYARHLPRPKPGHNRLLDVGCGNGEFLLRARQAGWEVAGLDFDPKAAAIAFKHGLDVWVGDFRKAPYRDGSFDAITSHQVIEHVHTPSDFIARLAAWLKPGGTLWLGTPNFASLGRSIFGVDWRHLHPPQHLILLSPKALLGLLHDNGLSARLYRRGFFETHMLAETLALRNGACTFDEVIACKPGYVRPILGGMLDLVAWIWPKLGSDIVAVGRKAA